MASNPDKIAVEASQWLARMERGLHDGEGQRLRQWLTDPLNRSCLLTQARLGCSAEVFAVLTQLFPDSPELKTSKKVRSVVNIAATTIAAIAIIIVAYFMLNDRMPWSYDAREVAEHRFIRAIYTTASGETRKVNLPDGGFITLNGGTRVVVMYWPHSRFVALPFGEATFHVVPSAERPFSVGAGKRLFHASETTFNVRVVTPEALELTVMDGNVDVAYEDRHFEETPALARLQPNRVYGDTTIGPLEVALVEPGLQFVRKVGTEELKERLRWGASAPSAR